MHASHKPRKFKSAKDELEAYGFVQRFPIRTWPYIYIGIVTTIALAFVVIAQLSPYGQEASQIAPIVIALGAFILGYQQWRAARNEISMDKYYDRLDKADQRLEGWPHARAMLSHFWEGQTDQATYERTNYVYVELDNLEYVIEKYKLGYVSPEQAVRGLRTFRSRCLSSEFRKIAARYIHSLEDAGYQTTTIEIVNRVLKEFESIPASTTHAEPES